MPSLKDSPIDTSCLVVQRHAREAQSGVVPAGSHDQRFPVRATAFAAETPLAREVLADSRTMKGGGAAGVAALGAAGVEVAQSVLAYMSFPRQHRTKLHSTNPIERLNKEVKRRADVVGIFPNEASILRLIGAVLFEQNDEWQTSSRYMMVEAFALIHKEEIDPILSITTKAA